MYTASLLLSWVASHALYASVWCRSRAAGAPMTYKEASERIEWELALRGHDAHENTEQVTYH